jgi:hypothetical protein
LAIQREWLAETKTNAEETTVGPRSSSPR